MHMHDLRVLMKYIIEIYTLISNIFESDKIENTLLKFPSLFIHQVVRVIIQIVSRGRMLLKYESCSLAFPRSVRHH